MRTGFTLAELLIALAILGVIATFTIPKVLQSQGDGRFNAIAKEAAGTIEGAYQQHVLNGLLNANTRGRELTPYMNYVSIMTTGTIDDRPSGTGTQGCQDTWPCLRLHNGAILQPFGGEYFNGTASTNYVGFTVDPDGQTTGKEDSLRLYLYYNGKITSRNYVTAGSISSGGVTLGPINNGDPPWFNWN